MERQSLYIFKKQMLRGSSPALSFLLKYIYGNLGSIWISERLSTDCRIVNGGIFHTDHFKVCKWTFLFPRICGINGIFYAQPVADILSAIITIFMALQLHRELSEMESRIDSEKQG